MVVTPLSGRAKFDEVINSGDVVIIDFWATWCGPCRVISPIFEKLSEEVRGPKFYKVDVDEEQEIAEEVGIKAMPIFMAFKDGQQIDHLIGATPQKLESLVKEAATH
ncbi:hypothetical protein N7474_008730 [Penicillium riverlandense]|uniref:uncharacterized protein n=1 Tax=Penicillium riverlandense TaxID=1903569 RepID=UPI0025496830|nr:uncharacterized protein N7474_008730 [Penicillium riverlandense]KAJ5812429.1 hypothetical protein N7474_008730 [Penicillium riverlandense]